jgi:carbon-monoxide dehydrogenase medium subunit
VVSIVHIPELHGVHLSDTGAGAAACEQGLAINALASLMAVERLVQPSARYTALWQGLASIASRQVKETGTLVGNLCVATPASDIAPPLVVLDAELLVATPAGTRTMPVGELFRGAKQNSLRAGELVQQVRLKAPPPGSGSAFAKLTRTAADCAKINAAAYLATHGRACTAARLCLGSVAATPLRLERAEAHLVEAGLEPATIARAAALAAEDIEPISDIRSTAEYRREAARVLVDEVLHQAVERALSEQP